MREHGQRNHGPEESGDEDAAETHDDFARGGAGNRNGARSNGVRPGRTRYRAKRSAPRRGDGARRSSGSHGIAGASDARHGSPNAGGDGAAHAARHCCARHRGRSNRRSHGTCPHSADAASGVNSPVRGDPQSASLCRRVRPWTRRNLRRAMPPNCSARHPTKA